MTVESTITSKTFFPGGAMASQSLAELIFADPADLMVFRLDEAQREIELLARDEHYSLTGAWALGLASITPLAAWDNTVRWRAVRRTALVQPERFPVQEPLSATAIERGLDRLTRIAQEQGGLTADLFARALQVPPGETAPAFPTIAERAGKMMAFGPSGDVVPVTGSGADAALRTDLGASGGAALVGVVQAGAGAVPRSLQAWARDWVDPKHFGAIGNDIADDTAAFAAAAATGKPVYVTHGTYRVAGCLFNARVFFFGGRIRRTGGTLAFAGGIAAAEGDNIFLDAVYPNVDVNNDLTPEGWVDWFGYDQDAIETCLKIFHVNRLGPRDYFLTRTLILDQSYREVIGSGGSAEGAGGTRLVMIGAAAADQPLVQVGTLNTTDVLSCSRRLNIRHINTIRAGATYQPVASGRREDAVPGWKIAGWYEGRMDDCFDYGSAIHYRVYATIGCTLNRCGGVRPSAGAANGHPDFYTAFCIGGYSTSFGFIGSNASITIENCGSAGGLGTARVGLYLFGYIGDSWIKKFEMSQLEYGVFVDGADAAGTPVASLSAHQDVRILECILDAILFRCVTVQNINAGGAVEVGGRTYCAQNAAGDTVLVNNCKGLVSLESMDIIANSTLANFGVRIAGSKRVTVSEAVHIKDCRVGVKAESSSALVLRPTITRASAGGTNAVELSGVGRSIVQPIVDADLAAFDYGISTDTGTNNCDLNVTGLNPGCFVGGTAARKIWHNGATWGGGGTFGTGNIATGVLG